MAMLFLTEHPDRVGRLALVSSAPPYAEARHELNERLAERMHAPEIVEARAQLRASGLRERDPEAYKQRAFELSVAGSVVLVEGRSVVVPVADDVAGAPPQKPASHA